MGARNHNQIKPKSRDDKMYQNWPNSDPVNAGTLSGFHSAPMKKF
jgi:hypothetical protein